MLKNKKSKKTPQMSGRVILTLPYVYVYPYELREGFCLAISCDTLKAAYLSVEDIKLYSLYKDENTFVGSCYAVKFGDMYYGNIVGTKEVFSFLPTDFNMKQTSELLAPLKIDKDAVYSLVCVLNKEADDLEAKLIKKVYKNNSQEEEILYTFADEVYFDEALNIAEKQLA